MPRDLKYLDVLAVGDANMDVWRRAPSHPHLTTSGERGMGVVGDAYHFGPGGGAANVAMGGARLGNKAGCVGPSGRMIWERNFRLPLRLPV